jgi:hypothetical protein
MPSYVIRKDEKGGKEVVWRNTVIDKPNLWNIIDAAEKEFPGVPKGKLYLMSGIMSITLKESPTIL